MKNTMILGIRQLQVKPNRLFHRSPPREPCGCCWIRFFKLYMMLHLRGLFLRLSRLTNSWVGCSFSWLWLLILGNDVTQFLEPSFIFWLITFWVWVRTVILFVFSTWRGTKKKQLSRPFDLTYNEYKLELKSICNFLGWCLSFIFVVSVHKTSNIQCESVVKQSNFDTGCTRGWQVSPACQIFENFRVRNFFHENTSCAT